MTDKPELPKEIWLVYDNHPAVLEWKYIDSYCAGLNAVSFTRTDLYKKVKAERDELLESLKLLLHVSEGYHEEEFMGQYPGQ